MLGPTIPGLGQHDDKLQPRHDVIVLSLWQAIGPDFSRFTHCMPVQTMDYDRQCMVKGMVG